ncbi:hypothetical protein AAFF_G00429490 [Aldrovandia affinis]|uniref:C-type lectin domain-containing protein n=1 Tax=Aldrovandia affinis TaxID=143900 RepID=A0AAD7VY67_9TELE|nr:hypothetical protein AAFF_G00429490 [Aldrovandia affinis]
MGTWLDLPCDRAFKSICYDGDAAQRYILIPERKTWREAQSYCREQHTDLASSSAPVDPQLLQRREIKGVATLPENSRLPIMHLCLCVGAGESDSKVTLTLTSMRSHSIWPLSAVTLE